MHYLKLHRAQPVTGQQISITALPEQAGIVAALFPAVIILPAYQRPVGGRIAFTAKQVSHIRTACPQHHALCAVVLPLRDDPPVRIGIMHRKQYVRQPQEAHDLIAVQCVLAVPCPQDKCRQVAALCTEIRDAILKRADAGGVHGHGDSGIIEPALCPLGVLVRLYGIAVYGKPAVTVCRQPPAVGLCVWPQETAFHKRPHQGGTENVRKLLRAPPVYIFAPADEPHSRQHSLCFHPAPPAKITAPPKAAPGNAFIGQRKCGMKTSDSRHVFMKYTSNVALI